MHVLRFQHTGCDNDHPPPKKNPKSKSNQIKLNELHEMTPHKLKNICHKLKTDRGTCIF